MNRNYNLLIYFFTINIFSENFPFFILLINNIIVEYFCLHTFRISNEKGANIFVLNYFTSEQSTTRKSDNNESYKAYNFLNSVIFTFHISKLYSELRSV